MKSPFEIIKDQTIVDLDLINENIFYVGQSSNSTELGNIYISDKDIIDDYINHNNISNGIDLTLYKDKKCYIMPGNSVTGQRTSEFLKTFDITVTNDSSKADIFIFNKRCDKTWDEEFNKNCCFYETNCTFSYTVEEDSNRAFIDFNLDLYKYENEIYGHKEYTNRYNYAIGGTALNILASGKKVIYEECLRDKMRNLVMDQDVYESLSAALNSNRDEDQSMVAKVIPTIDITKNQHLVFKFLFEHQYKLLYGFNRDKDVQSFNSDNYVNKFSESNSSYLIRMFDQEDKLTKEGFRFLERNARSRIEIYNKEIYSFTVKVKEEYKKYLAK